MTVDPVLMNVFMSVITVLVCGLSLKIGWNWLQSGRVKTGEYYRTIQSCDECRAQCKDKLTKHIEHESGQFPQIGQRLESIEKRMEEAKQDAYKMREEVKQETAGLRKEVTGIRSALDRLAGTFEGYVKQNGRYEQL